MARIDEPSAAIAHLSDAGRHRAASANNHRRRVAMSIRDLIPWGRAGIPSLGPNADPVTSLQHEMNRLFDSAFREFRAPEGFGRVFGGGWPTIAVAEQDRAYVVTAELPGLEEKDVEVSLNDSALVIRGEKKASAGDEKSHVNEHFWGRFERRIPVGPEVDREGVNASFANGVLTVTLPKSPQAASASKRIPISAAPAQSITSSQDNTQGGPQGGAKAQAAEVNTPNTAS
jgi:HSP20 family protein